MKVVIGPSVAGLQLSNTTITLYAERKGWPPLLEYTQQMAMADYNKGRPSVPVTGWYNADVTDWSIDWVDHILDYSFFVSMMSDALTNPKIFRNDPVLVGLAEELGEEFTKSDLEFEIVDVPDGVDWIISEGEDGREYVAEKARVFS